MSIRVAVEDDANQVVTSDNSTLVTLDLTQDPAGGTLTCMNAQGRGPVAVQNGIEDFVCSIDKAGGGYVLSVVDSTGATGHPYAQAVSNAFAVTAGPPAQLVFSGEPTSTTSEATFSPTVEVTVEDAAGNTVATDNSTSVTVALGTNPGGAVLGGTLTRTVHDGLAAFADLTLDKAGVGYTLTAASSPATSGATSTAFDVAAGVPAQLVFSGEPTSTTAGATISPAVQATVEDADGNIVTADSTTTVTVALGTNPGGAALGGTLTQTVHNGVATFADLNVTVAATGYTLTVASSPATSNATSTAFDVAAGAPAQLVFSGEPTGTSAGSAIDPAVQVTVEDSYGNVVDSDNTTTVTVAIGANPGGSTLGGTLTQTVQNGVASFPDLTLDNAGTGYTLTAVSAPATNSPTSTAFDIGSPGLVHATLLTTNAAHPCTSGASCTTGSFTAAPGATLLVLAQRGGSTTSSDAITTVTGPVLAPLPVASLEYPTSIGRDYLFAWKATGTGITGSLTVQFALGSNANPTVVEVVELTGVDPLFPVAQSPTALAVSGNATATLVAPDPANGELLLVAFQADKPIAPPLGFGTIDAFKTGSNGGEDYSVFFDQSAHASTTVTAPAVKGWGTIAIELAHA